MRGELKINNKDAWENWGVSLADGSVTALMTPAPQKPLITNSSRVKNGKEVILTDNRGANLRRMADRDVLMIINMFADSYAQLYSRQKALEAELTSQRTVLWTSFLSGLKFHLDYISCTEFSQFRGQMAKYILKFNEPDPTNRS